MQKLEAGIHHFQANYFASNRKLFEQLATARPRPETLFITCSDSRVVSNLITSAPPGGARYGHLEAEARQVAAVEENVLLQLENLRSFPFVLRRLDEGTLKMNGWVFKIATGEVFDYDPASQQFMRLGEGRTALTERPRSP